MSYLGDWNFLLQRFLFPRRKLFFIPKDRFVFRTDNGEFLCGLQYVDYGLKQWAFCVTYIESESKVEQPRVAATWAAELRNYALGKGASKCLVLFSPSGWPKDAFLLQKDGIIWG